MEMQRYVQILMKWWLVVVVGLLVTSLLTVGLVLREPPTYESTGTFVVRPRMAESGDLLRAIDTLTRGVEISSTYVTVARSALIRGRAQDRLGASGGTPDLMVNAEAVTGTNVVQITVTGPDPQRVHDMAMAVGAETVAYVAELRDAFELTPLDQPQIPTNPVAPNVPLRIGTGLVFGLALGGMLAFTAEGLQLSLGRNRERDKLARRLQKAHVRGGFVEGLVNALRSDGPLTVGVLRMTPNPQASERRDAIGSVEKLKSIALERMPTLRDDDIVTYIGDGTFAVIRPNATVEEVEALLRAWKWEIDAAAVGHGDHVASRSHVSASVFTKSELGDPDERLFSEMGIG